MNKLLLFNCVMLFNNINASEILTEQQAYKILNITKKSSQKEITQAYRKLARKYHPDKNNEYGAEDQFKTISQAYQFLHKQSSEEFLKLDTGLTFEQVFKMQNTIRSINQHIQTYQGKLPAIFTEQQMPTNLNESNYCEQFKIKKNLLNQIKKEVAQFPKIEKIKLPKINGDTLHCAQVMTIFAEINKKYQQSGFSLTLPNPVGITVQQAEVIYKYRIEHVKILHEIKEIVDRNKDYFDPDALIKISRIESTPFAQEQLYQVKKIVADKEEEIIKISKVFEEIKHVWKESSLTGTLPEAKHVTLDWAKEQYESTQFFAECLQSIQSAINKNQFSAQFRNTIPTILKSSEEAKQTLNMINKEIERLRIEREIIRRKYEKIDKLNDACSTLNNKVKIDTSYVALKFQDIVSERLALIKNQKEVDHDFEQRLDDHIENIQEISKTIDENIQQNKIKKIRELNDNKIKYQSFATFGLYPSLKKKTNDKLQENLHNIEQKKQDQDLHQYINMKLKQAEEDESKARRASVATISAGLGVATTITGIAVHYYFKNK